MDIYAQLQALEPGKYAVVKKTRFRWLERFLIKGYVVRLEDRIFTQSDIDHHFRISEFRCVALVFSPHYQRYVNYTGVFMEMSAPSNVTKFDEYLKEMFTNVTFRKVKP